MTKHTHTRGRGSVSVTLRMSVEERQALRDSALDRTLSETIRSILFNPDNPPGNGMRFSAHARQKLLAQILAELGRTDIAGSLRGLSKAADIGALPLTPAVLSEIEAAIRDVKTIRTELLKALGLRPESGSAE